MPFLHLSTFLMFFFFKFYIYTFLRGVDTCSSSIVIEIADHLDLVMRSLVDYISILYQTTNSWARTIVLKVVNF